MDFEVAWRCCCWLCLGTFENLYTVFGKLIISVFRGFRMNMRHRNFGVKTEIDLDHVNLFLTVKAQSYDCGTLNLHCSMSSETKCYLSSSSFSGALFSLVPSSLPERLSFAVAFSFAVSWLCSLSLSQSSLSLAEIIKTHFCSARRLLVYYAAAGEVATLPARGAGYKLLLCDWPIILLVGVV